jgi:hypothetical protein
VTKPHVAMLMVLGDLLGAIVFTVMGVHYDSKLLTWYGGGYAAFALAYVQTYCRCRLDELKAKAMRP